MRVVLIKNHDQLAVLSEMNRWFRVGWGEDSEIFHQIHCPLSKQKSEVPYPRREVEGMNGREGNKLEPWGAGWVIILSDLSSTMRATFSHFSSCVSQTSEKGILVDSIPATR